VHGRGTGRTGHSPETERKEAGMGEKDEKLRNKTRGQDGKRECKKRRKGRNKEKK
jgi:hypothetical protein